jgi:hypothetical protein
MSTLTVNSKVINYPDQGKEGNWGSEASDFATEVSSALNNLSGPGSITETQSLIENNVLSSSTKNVAGLIFNSSLSKSASVTYRIYRKSASTSELSEEGNLFIHYSALDPLNKWSLTREITNNGPALVYLDIDNNGQVKYSSSNVAGTGYEGYITFKSTHILR